VGNHVSTKWNPILLADWY
jgi:hypothetical protein